MSGIPQSKALPLPYPIGVNAPDQQFNMALRYANDRSDETGLGLAQHLQQDTWDSLEAAYASSAVSANANIMSTAAPGRSMSTTLPILSSMGHTDQLSYASQTAPQLSPGVGHYQTASSILPDPYSTHPQHAPAHTPDQTQQSLYNIQINNILQAQQSSAVQLPVPQQAFAAQTTTTTALNGAPKTWPDNTATMMAHHQTHMPVWVPIHPATGTASPFVRVSEILDEDSAVAISAAMAHSPLSAVAHSPLSAVSHSPLSAVAPSPLSVPEPSVQGSPSQYRMHAAFASQSPPLWSQARLPSVASSTYTKPVLNSLNDQALSQQYDDRPSSGVSTQQPTTPPGSGNGAKSWATPADWLHHRDCITRLYIEEDKPLKEVMDMMARDYGFYATEKMYKIKIKKWNLKKNLRENEVQAIIQQVSKRDAEGKSSAVMIHGKQFELSQIFRHAKKKGILKSQRRSRKKRAQGNEPVVEQDVPHYVRIYTPTPVRESPQFVLRAPDALHVPEQVLCNLGVWMEGKVQSGAWSYWMRTYSPFNETTETKGDPTGASVTLISDFYNHFLQGLQTLRTTRDVPVATRSFNIAFATLKNCMMMDDPRLMAMLLLTGLRTEKEGHGRDLGEMLWRYVRELSPYCVGAHSPLNRVWGTIATAFIYNDVGQSMVLMRFLADQIKTWVNKYSNMYVDFFMFQSEIERLSFGSSPATRATLRQMLQDSRMAPIQDYNNIIMQKNLCHQLARSLIKDNHPEEARTVLLQTPSAPLNNSRSARVVYLDLLANIELECGMPDIAAETMEKAVSLSTMLWGEMSSSTMHMVDTLIKIYSQQGALARADALRVDFERRERFLENFHHGQLPPHVPPIQIGC